MLIDDALFERNDRVIGNCNMLGANFGAAFRDIAIADAVSIPQVAKPILGVQRMHFQGG